MSDNYDNVQNTENTYLQSISSKKKTFYQILIRLYFAFIFVNLPLTILQQLFFVPLDKTTDLPYHAIWISFKQHILSAPVLTIYFCYFVLASIGLFVFLYPIREYLLYNNNRQQVYKKIQNPIGLLFIVVITLLISWGISYYLFKNQFPISGKMHVLRSFVYVFFWQILIGFYLILTFLQATNILKDSLKLYYVHSEDLKFYFMFKEYIFLAIQLLLIMIIIIQTINLSEIEKSVSNLKEISAILAWGFINSAIIVGISSCLLYSVQKINQRFKNHIKEEFENLVQSGYLNKQIIYYEPNELGNFTSIYNKSMIKLTHALSQFFHNTNELRSNNTSLRKHTSELIEALDEQENKVSQMNIASQVTNKSLQELAKKVDSEYHTLSNDLTNIDNLISGTQNIISVFSEIEIEQIQSEKSSQAGLKSVNNSIKKSILMNEKIKEITTKIKQAGHEAAGIDEVLKVIKNISEQTNILSMSAAIEAAHGGTSGNGFALVAKEVRKLANMSQASADKIASRLSAITELIKDSFNISQKSLELANQNSRISKQLGDSMANACTTAAELTKITRNAGNITNKQGINTYEFKTIVLSVLEFLQNIYEELKSESSVSDTMSLNFNNIIENFKTVRSTLYHMDTTLEKLNITEQQLYDVIQEFSLTNNNDYLFDFKIKKSPLNQDSDLIDQTHSTTDQTHTTTDQTHTILEFEKISNSDPLLQNTTPLENIELVQNKKSEQTNVSSPEVQSLDNFINHILEENNTEREQ
ncbi:MAG: methyl-accepting chemotaxis protein [Brevinemataceae bacterium]